MARHKLNLFDIIRNTIFLVPNFINILSNISALIHIETRMTAKLMMRIVTLSVIFAILLTSCWLYLLGILFFYLMTSQSLLIAFFSVLAIHLIAMIATGCYLMRMKGRLFFPATVSECQHLYQTVKEETYE